MTLTALCQRASLLVLVLVCTLLLAACAGPTPVVRPAEPVPLRAQRYTASFDCMQPETPVQHYVCRDAALAEADRQLNGTWREQVRRQDLAGRAELLAAHRHWQLSLYSRCGVGGVPDEAQALPAAPVACLREAWRTRTADLQAMPAPQEASVAPDGARADHPLAAYVVFREAQWLEPGLCARATAGFNGLLARVGALAMAQMPGARLWATVGLQRVATLPDGRRVEVLQHDAGPYGSYALRATGLQLDGQKVLDDRSVPAWLLELPNAGGSFSGSSSQTGDYAGIDVFTFEQRTWVLVTQTWGYYASAARGESPHAALYEVVGNGLQRRCLWRTYTTPPVANALRLLPRFKQLQGLLDEAAGADSPRLPPDDRRDAGLLNAEMQWTLLNMPLLAVREADRHARWPLLRQRNDEALDALFDWSERNVPSKQLYRRLMPLISVAHAELDRAFRDSEGLTPSQALAAADWMLMAALARAAEHWRDPALPRPSVAGSPYRARFPVAPAAGHLERDRAYGGLHSALLNRAPEAVIDDLWRFTWGRTDRVGDPAAGKGPAGDTPLMAAVRSPAHVARLLAAGADVNATNAWGKTALMTAAQADQIDSVRLLLAGGADVSRRTQPWQADGAGGLDNSEGSQAGRTALMWAALHAQPAVVEALLAAGASPADRDARYNRACELLAQAAPRAAAVQAQLKQQLCSAP